VWWVDVDPTRGREQATDRPALVVSSAEQLRDVRGALAQMLIV
jgi:mRNA interferase MazF